MLFDTLPSSPVSPARPSVARRVFRSCRASAIAVAGALVLAGCGALFPGSGRSTVEIASLAELERADRPVSVAGEIVRRVPLVDGTAYLIEDETGSIWVRTDRPLTDGEQRVKATGTIASLETGDRYLREVSREAIEPEAPEAVDESQ